MVADLKELPTLDDLIGRRGNVEQLVADSAPSGS
jgi:hypothetical protein